MKAMNTRNKCYVLLLTSVLITSCDEMHVLTSFNDNESGSFKLDILYDEDKSFDDMGSTPSTCLKSLEEIWESSALSQNVIVSVENRKNRSWCVYSYQFQDLTELVAYYTSLNINIENLTTTANTFTYQIPPQACEPLSDETNQDPNDFTWSIKVPGEISEHNANKVIGNTLTWIGRSLECDGAFAKANLSQPSEPVVTEELPENLVIPQETAIESQVPEQPLSMVVVLTTIGASIATIVATIIAYLELRKK